MKIVVIVKEVPNTEAVIELAGNLPAVSGLKMVLNPYDEYAIEEAIRHGEAQPGTQVIALFAGSGISRENVTDVLALGADEAVVIDDAALAGSDPLQVATLLAAAVNQIGADYVLAGRQGVDYDWGLTGIALATKLGWAHVGLVSKLDVNGTDFRTESEGDAGKLITEGRLPAVFTIDKGINEPRYKSLKGIMAAKKKPVNELSLAALGIDPAAVGAGSAGVELLRAEKPPVKLAGRIIEGATVEEKVRNLVDALVNEAKVL